MATKKNTKNKSQSNHKAALKWAVEDLTPQFVLAVTFVVLGAAIMMMIFAGYSLKLGQQLSQSQNAPAPNSENVSILGIEYQLDSFDYVADDNCVHGVSSERCLLENYGAKGSNYAVISSSDQLNRLMNVLNSISGQEFSKGVDASFFDSGSFVAIVDESGLSEYNLSGAYRDEAYGLHFQTTGVKNNANDIINTGHLLLIQVPNIQTSDIYINSSEIEK